MAKKYITCDKCRGAGHLALGRRCDKCGGEGKIAERTTDEGLVKQTKILNE